jgi:predicted esterase
VGYLDRLHEEVVGSADPPARVGVLGFSQGLHTAARWVTLGRVAPARTVLWGAYLPDDLEIGRARAAFAATRLTFVQGRADPHRSEALEHRHQERLAALGVECETLWHDGGHALDEGLLGEVLTLH